MRKVCFAVKDTKAGAFVIDPMFAVSVGVAERSFREAIENRDLVFWKNPGDYELWLIGWFNPETGVFEPMGPEFVINGAQVARTLSAE